MGGSSYAAPKLFQRFAIFFENRGFIRFGTPILTPSACEGTSTLFGTQYFDEKSLSHSIRTTLRREVRSHGFRQDLCLWPDVSRRKIQDAQASDRVLDGRARSGLCRPRGQHALWESNSSNTSFKPWFLKGLQN